MPLRAWPASTIAGAVVGVIGAVVLAGWALDLPVLTRVVPGLPTMKGSTATAFVLMGLALILLDRSARLRWARAVRRGAATIATLIGLVTLADYAADLNLAIEHVLVHDVVSTGGRMPPVTALGLATSGVAFLLLDIGRFGALAQILAIAAAMLGFLNLVGYAYSFHSLRELARYTAVALHTAIGLGLLGAGILLARPERGLTRMALADTPAGVVVRRLLPVVIAVPLVFGWLVELGRHAGLYGPEFAMALSVVGTVVALTGVVWSAASALQRTDVRRRRAETLLHRADAEVDELTGANKALVEMTARLRTLERLNRLVSSSLDFDAVLVAIARAAADLTATPVVSFWLVDEVAGTVTVRAWSDAAIGADFPGARFPFGQGAVGTVAVTRQPVHIPDVFAAAATPAVREWCRRHDLPSYYGLPVFAQHRLLAVLALSRRTPLPLGEEDQELLASFVAQAAVAIENARLFAEAQERRHAAETAEARYGELFDRNLAGIFRATREGRILDCNDAMVRILGYATRADVLALRADDLYVDPAEAARVVVPLQAGDRLSNAEFRWRRADGTPITVLVNVAATLSGEPGVVLEGIVVDITARDRAEEAEREAEALRAVTKLANAAAHEINNPLSVVLAHLDILNKRFEHDADAAQRLERARSACRRIAEMITHMGRITRLEEYRQSPNLPPILDLRRSSEGDPS